MKVSHFIWQLSFITSYRYSTMRVNGFLDTTNDQREYGNWQLTIHSKIPLNPHSNWWIPTFACAEPKICRIAFLGVQKPD
jgi:hypothetical protein